MEKLKQEDLEKRILKTITTEKFKNVHALTQALVEQKGLSGYTLSGMRTAIDRVMRKHNVEIQPEDTVEQELAEYRNKVQNKDVTKVLNDLKDNYIALKDQFDDMLMLDKLQIKARKIPKSAKDLKEQAVPIIQWSDWHVGKHIDIHVMNGLNEFNPQIAKERAMSLFDNTVKMIKLHKTHAEITQGVLHLGGDFIEGYLREYNMQENTMSPIEEVIFATELLVTGIQSLIDEKLFDTLHVLCNRGNHSRLTQRMQSNDHRVNYETLIFFSLIQRFSTNEHISFEIPEGDIGYFDIMGKKIRFFHGHQVKYGGGIGGLAIPLRKGVMNYDMTTKADYNLMGHYHQSYKPLSNVMMNGSLCGYDPYAQTIGAPFQSPLQSMELLVDKRGFRMFTSIDCE